MKLFQCFANPVQSALVYQQPLANNLQGIFSNQGGQEVADSVSLAMPTSVTRITWYGLYGLSNFELSPATTSLRFNVSFLPDSSGAPGAAPLFSQSFNAGVQSTGQRMNTPGMPFDGNLIYRYDTDLPSSFAITAGATTWLSIVAADTSTPHPQWLWARSSYNPNDLAYRNTYPSAEHSWTIISSGGSAGQTAFAFTGPVSELEEWSMITAVRRFLKIHR